MGRKKLYNTLNMMLFSISKARSDFEKNHPSPEVITLDGETKVTNKGNTSNRHPNGDFGNSWMKY